MKLNVYILSIAFLISVFHIQEIKAQLIGVKTGPSYIKIEDYEGSSDKTTGWSGGIYYRYGLLTSVQAEINYRQKGAKIRIDEKNIDLELNYIDIPVLFGVNLFFLYINAGPYYGILTSAEFDGSNAKSNFKSNDFGLQYGGGVRLPILKKFWFEFDGRICHGLYEIDNAEKYKNVRNKTWGITAGLVYRFSK